MGSTQMPAAAAADGAGGGHVALDNVSEAPQTLSALHGRTGSSAARCS